MSSYVVIQLCNTVASGIDWIKTVCIINGIVAASILVESVKTAIGLFCCACIDVSSVFSEFSGTVTDINGLIAFDSNFLCPVCKRSDSSLYCYGDLFFQ